MNPAAASVIMATVVTICATVAGCLHVIDGTTLATIYTAEIAGGGGYIIGKQRTGE